MFVELEKITPSQLNEFVRDAEAVNLNVIEYMIKERVIQERDVHEAWSLERNVPFVDISEVPVPELVSGLIPHEQARELQVIPYEDDGQSVYVATKRYNDITLESQIRALIPGRSIRLIYCFQKDLERRVSQIYSASKQGELIANEVSQRQNELDKTRRAASVTEDASPGGIQATVRLIIQDGIDRRASDIHVEPHEFTSQVRYEVDGIVQDGMSNNLNIHANLIAAIKVMANMGLDERIRSSGRIEYLYHSKATGKREQIDLRVESLPTVRGQRITMRILDNSTARLPLSSLGFAKENLESFKSAYTQPIGLVLLNGPTGSGKSTTLYSTLNEVYTPEKTIYTVENPVEYRIDGISQVQVNDEAGMSFGEALKGFMRMAPKILLVGEIRDTETANLAIDFALTGHLVLSTLHANDAPLAISRLVKMGVDPFLVGDSLECSVAQRLCRVLCDVCKEEYVPTSLELRKIGIRHQQGEPLPEGFETLFKQKGCDECRHTGYRGRSSIHEVMLMNDEISQLVADSAPTALIRKAAIENGMIPLIQDGVNRVVAGDTSIDEISRVIRVR